MSTHKLYDLALNDRDMLPVIAYGTAGTGKTYGACKAAVAWLKTKNNKFLGVRPNVPFADEVGFLPGTEREKLEPWIRPISQNLYLNGMNNNEQDCLEKHGRIQYMALSHIQGLTFDNTFMFIDECENMTFNQIKGVVTRIGKYSKLVLAGDIAQISELFKNSGLAEYIDMCDHFDARVHTIEFKRDDIMRSEICKQQIVMFEEWERRE